MKNENIWYDNKIRNLSDSESDKILAKIYEQQKHDKIESCVRCYEAGSKCFQYFIENELKYKSYQWLEKLSAAIEYEEIQDEINKYIILHKLIK